jgi:hypothetical protein
MSALQLALKAKCAGVRFVYDGDLIAAQNLDRLPPGLRTEVERRLSDILAVVAEHSPPGGIRVTDVIDAARRIVTDSRKAIHA